MSFFSCKNSQKTTHNFFTRFGSPCCFAKRPIRRHTAGSISQSSSAIRRVHLSAATQHNPSCNRKQCERRTGNAIETTASCRPTHIRIAVIKDAEYKYWRGCGDATTLTQCWAECEVWSPNIQSTHEPAILLPRSLRKVQKHSATV